MSVMTVGMMRMVRMSRHRTRRDVDFFDVVGAAATLASGEEAHVADLNVVWFVCGCAMLCCKRKLWN